MSKSEAIMTGVSSRIGKATAIRLARDFAAVALAARGAVAGYRRAHGFPFFSRCTVPDRYQLRIDGGEVKSI
jgi:NAD(P)-dependent dehydrogenase (short-subunit alcohol dehydrogenase family)